MPGQRRQLKRIDGWGHTRYLTCSCYQRLPLFSNDAIKDAFAGHLAFVRRALGFRLHAWVIMPEHFHLLLTPTGETTVTALLRRLKAPFARRVIRRWRSLDAPILSRITAPDGRPRFWQAGGGYDRNIVSNHELIEKIRYIHENPVHRDLVSNASHWRWSSWNWYNGDRVSTVPIDPIPSP